MDTNHQLVKKKSQELLLDISWDLPDFIHQQYLHEDLKLVKVVETYVFEGTQRTPGVARISYH